MTDPSTPLAGPPAVAAAAAVPAPRERLLDAAAELFHREGVHVGVDALCRAAGVSKRSMYQLFGSKDEVVAAALERRGPSYAEALLPGDGEGLSPRERILHVFRRLEESVAAGGESGEFLGCPYVAAAVELKSPEHPGSRVALRQKSALTEYFRQQAEAAGAREPELLARQLTVAFDGASAWSVVRAEGLAGLAVSTAEALLAAARVGTDAGAGAETEVEAEAEAEAETEGRG